MKKFTIEVSDEAKEDLDNLAYVITYEYRSFRTAKRYLDGIFDTIASLRTMAGSYMLRKEKYYLQYGLFVRRVNYKKMAIIYTVHGETVYIHRVVPASTITGL